VAGQSPLGYERAVLERGSAPASFVRDVRALESVRQERRAWLAEGADGTDGRHPLAAAVLTLAPGVRVERKPVLEEGEFAWGHALITPGYPEGTPCSAFVATLLSSIDGRTSTDDLIARLGGGAEPAQAALIGQNVLAALSILYVDGAVEPVGTGA
jgi:hypothetical protein